MWLIHPSHLNINKKRIVTQCYPGENTLKLGDREMERLLTHAGDLAGMKPDAVAFKPPELQPPPLEFVFKGMESIPIGSIKTSCFLGYFSV